VRNASIASRCLREPQWLAVAKTVSRELSFTPVPITARVCRGFRVERG
jgi:hypothetical protein